MIPPTHLCLLRASSGPSIFEVRSQQWKSESPAASAGRHAQPAVPVVSTLPDQPVGRFRLHMALQTLITCVNQLMGVGELKYCCFPKLLCHCAFLGSQRQLKKYTFISICVCLDLSVFPCSVSSSSSRRSIPGPCQSAGSRSHR